MSALLAIVSRDADYYLMLSYILRGAGYRTVLVDIPNEAVAIAEELDAAAIIVDCQPGSQILADIASGLKERGLAGNVTLIALVAERAAYLDILKANVDESFTRPMPPERLLSYLHGEIGNSSGEASGRLVPIFDDMKLDVSGRRVLVRGMPVNLSPIEFRLLSALMGDAGRVLSRAELISVAWPKSAFVEPRTVDVHIGRLRRALRRALGRDVIRTVPKEGYAIDVGQSM
ncbi:winged helix-turn-helix transcriptional regulator [Rhizobium beringeri]|uniref:winged helix-turn-helix transcriptional regulator n=1 Tax=Rhizobium TaxID=379 RepID=UPI0010314E7F|nr:response regulator transcription factor [Rhizobium ruizarguesonis]TBA24767.1 DNA-binding response regulator [Rhizobium ruizarguesonis]TBA46533.1 DNA-binding response regulator [Rhizobium ruizarguesonis]TBB96171.1 DNA-binding response regulator [Rhizobium ruizarguesonis]